MTSLATSSASARLDRIPLATRTHRVWAGLLCAVFLFELADLNTFAYVAPALKKHWGGFPRTSPRSACCGS
jgi:putative MFS transporter